MGLILRSSSLANSGNTVSVKGSALSYIEGDGNFVYLLTNMSGSVISLTGSVQVDGSITGSFTGSLANLTGAPTYIPYFKTSQSLASSVIRQVDNGDGSYSIALNQITVTSAAPEALLVSQSNATSYNVIGGKGNLDNYLQLNIQNLSNGGNVSSDVVATADNGNEVTNYIDMGINGSNFGGIIGGPNDAYLYSTGSNLHIGNINPNTYLGFFAGGTNVTVNNKLRLYPNNNHTLSGSLDISGSLVVLSVTGSLTGSLTGSVNGPLFGTSSFATIAQTASSANDFNVRNTLTATTIIVQTITSSVSYLTGSTRFGSNITDNTHTFTGSILLTGSLVATGSIDITGSAAITGGFTVFTGSIIEFQVSNTGIKIGNSISDTHTITGSLSTSGSVTIFGNKTITGSVSISGSKTIIGNNIITGSLLLSGSTTSTGSIASSGSITVNFGGIIVTGSLASSGSIVVDSGSIQISSGSIFTPKLIGNTKASVMAAGTGAGSGPTISISGSDVAGYIRVLTGTGPAAKNEIVTVTFTSVYAGLPFVLITPASFSSSLSFGGVSGAFATASTTGFTIFSSEGALRGATAYTWSYHVFG